MNKDINLISKDKINFEFLKSALTCDGHYIKTIDVITWLQKQKNDISVNIKKIPFNKLNLWSFHEKNGSLNHASGRFFSIEGINVKTNWGCVSHWEQPIINQPDIGYLGLIVKNINGVLHFLLQAKVEPGNVNYVQLSPTIQATKSNYEQVHKGKKTLYLECFQNATAEQILLDQLQSEQGARFLKKRNRNIIIQIYEEIPIYDNFIWLTLAQIKNLIQYENLVNMDVRTVISGIPFGSFNLDTIDLFCFLGEKKYFQTLFLKSALLKQNSLHSIDEIITFLTELKSTHNLEVTNIPLNNMKKWEISDYEIFHKDKKYFKIIAVKVEIENREVMSWCQPIVEPAQEGICAFVCKEINGILHFAVQAKLECGNHDVIEFAPTVQTLTGNYKEIKKNTLPFLDYILNVSKEKIFVDVYQSEEGGRFFREQNRNMIVIAGDEISISLPPNFIWMTLNQLQVFLKFNNYLNIQARSLIACIPYV